MLTACLSKLALVSRLPRHLTLLPRTCDKKIFPSLAVNLANRREYRSDGTIFGYWPERSGDWKYETPHSSKFHNIYSAYRRHGHLKATIDPLGLIERCNPTELDPAFYGIDQSNAVDNDGKTLNDLLTEWESTYCANIGAEFEHMESLEEREWFAKRLESLPSHEVPNETKVAIAKLMNNSQAMDQFLAKKFASLKRYGGEGAESMMAFFLQLLKSVAAAQVEEVVVCTPHRGRNNLLACLLDYPVETMFRKIRGFTEFPPDVKATGDVLAHLSTSTDLTFDGQQVHVVTLANPSHLEAVNAVGLGKTRARQQTLGEGDYSCDGSSSPGDKVICLQVHGDAAFIGQGVVAECFVMSNAPHFRTGGSVHLIVNNQVGFTTEAERSRSSRYSSDISKITNCPVLHVNGDHPEAVAKCTQLAVEYRQKFRKDVVVDLYCYRLFGHNELDDPTFTQPLMYKAIHDRMSIPDKYSLKLVTEGIVQQEELDQSLSDFTSRIDAALTAADNFVPVANHLEKQWSTFVQASDHVTSWDTGVDSQLLKFIGGKSIELGEDAQMELHDTIARAHIRKRLEKVESGVGIDWATAEALSIGSLLLQGYGARICGQDVGRGTFSQRHFMLVCQDTDLTHIPLNHLVSDQTAFLEVANSILSEEAVLGFEYGMSIENPRRLIIWEAQFGDFFNGAQIIIDSYITQGETKWLTQSGLVMLLPHGFDGAGPEHSSCRLERFLQCCDSKEDGVDGDDVNVNIVNPTTPAQYFHLLRRQMLRNFRKPLIVASPKLLLRHTSAVSELSDMAPGTQFKPVLDDPKAPRSAKRIVFCCGKHYYELAAQRSERGLNDAVALIRVESLCPFPTRELQDVLQKYSSANDFVWSQEEHRNMGAWNFVNARFANTVGVSLRYVGRNETAAITGIAADHKQQSVQVLDQTFSKL